MIEDDGEPDTPMGREESHGMRRTHTIPGCELQCLKILASQLRRWAERTTCGTQGFTVWALGIASTSSCRCPQRYGAPYCCNEAMGCARPMVCERFRKAATVDQAVTVNPGRRCHRLGSSHIVPRGGKCREVGQGRDTTWGARRAGTRRLDAGGRDCGEAA